MVEVCSSGVQPGEMPWYISEYRKQNLYLYFVRLLLLVFVLFSYKHGDYIETGEWLCSSFIHLIGVKKFSGDKNLQSRLKNIF